MLLENERLDDLHRKGYKIIQNTNGFCFGIDAVLLSGFAKVKKGEIALDMCTGTGAIAISVAHYTKAKVTASDISSKALEVARENAKILNADVNFIESDLFENINETFDVLVSNPPYIESEVIPTLMEQVKDYEPMLALDGGKDGLDFYRNIINQAKNYINQNGCIVFEIGYNQGGQVKSLLENAGFVNINVKQDLAGLDRLVIGLKL